MTVQQREKSTSLSTPPGGGDADPVDTSKESPMTTVSTADSAAGVRAFGQRWWLLAVFGVVTVGFGIVLTFKPAKSVHAIAIIIGIWLLILGVVQLIRAIGAPGERTAFVVMGLLAIVIALILLHHTTTTVGVLGFIVGIFWTIGGVSELVHGFSANDGAVSWPTVILGLIGTIIGVLCLVYPSLSLSIICVIVGLGMVVYGIVEIAASLQVREAQVL
jgi:uncharacterized membrane protein HdeD (DUF308 family)